MQPFVRYHGHKLQTLFQKGQYFAATYQQQVCRLPVTVSTLNCYITFTLLPWQGDSGGPAFCGNTIVGITSWGDYNCDGFHPTVYTRVSSYIDWIKEKARL